MTIGEAMLKVHRSYLQAIQGTMDIDGVHAYSHITGGGIPGNLVRTGQRSRARYIGHQPGTEVRWQVET